MALFAIAVPILPDKTAEAQALIEAINGPRNAEFKASRNGLGVHERTFHQKTPHGELVIVTLEGDDPAAAFTKFAEADDAFTAWFRERVMEVHGIDVAAPAPGPLPELVIDSAR